MERILIQINIPAGNTKYDVFVPKTALGNDVLKIVSNLFSSMLEGKFKESIDTVLVIQKNGKILDINKTIYEQEIENGSVLLLI